MAEESDRYWQQRRLSRRRFLAGSGVAAAGSVALLAGCGGGSPAPSPVATEPPKATSPAVATEAPATAPASTSATTPLTLAEAPRRGGTLRLWKKEEDSGLDPGVFHLGNTEVIYSTMTQPFTYQPTKNLLAMDGMVGYEQVDPTTFVWSIRPGMTFHTGDPVDSEAVAFSFGRLAKLHGVLDVVHVRRDGHDFVDSFEATDTLTLTEHWARPNADAPVHRARHYYSFLNPRVVEEHGKFEGSYEHVNGTLEDVFSVQELPFGSGSGPYTLAKRDETGTRVERWPGYHGHTPADDGFVEDGPYINAWETRTLGNREAAKRAFLAGELDVFASITAEEMEEFDGRDDISVTAVPNGSFSLLGMDGNTLYDTRARRAVYRALDYESLIKAVHPRGGKYRAPISDLLPHFQQLSQQELKQWYRYDPDEARALWEAADRDVPARDMQVTRMLRGHENEELIADLVAFSLGTVLGVTREVRAISLAAVDFASRSQARNYIYGSGFYVGGTGTFAHTSGLPTETFLDYYNPLHFARALGHHTESPNPEIAADAAELIAMLAAQEQELDFDTRVGLLTEIQRWILDRAWCNVALPTANVSYYGFSSRLRDHGPDDWSNYYGLRRESMWLAEG